MPTCIAWINIMNPVSGFLHIYICELLVVIWRHFAFICQQALKYFQWNRRIKLDGTKYISGICWRFSKLNSLFPLLLEETLHSLQLPIWDPVARRGASNPCNSWGCTMCADLHNLFILSVLENIVQTCARTTRDWRKTQPVSPAVKEMLGKWQKCENG